MKNFLTLVLCIFLGFAVVSCGDKEDGTPSPVKTVTADLIAKSFTKAIVIVGSCENEQQVFYDIDVMVKDWFKLEKQKGIGSELCKQAVSALLPIAIGTGTEAVFKEDWECSGENLENAGVLIAETACGFIPLALEN